MRPIDARMSLPEGEYSYLLQEFSQYFCIEEAFGKAQQGIEKVLGQKLPVDSLERINRELGRQAEPLARERLLRILQGQVQGVILGLRQMATRRELEGSPLDEVATACNYFEKNAYRMRYDEYLEEGYPIARAKTLPFP